MDAPPEGPDGQAGVELLSDLGVLSHFDAVLYYTGDDLLPQAPGEGVTDENYRRGGTVSPIGTFSLTGSQHLTNAGVRNAQMLRNYMNEGGKVVFEGRNPWLQQTSTSNGLNTYSNYSWWQEPVYGFDYPPDQGGDDDRPHTAFFRELEISNDWAQWWLGLGPRQGGAGTTTFNSGAVQPVGTDGFLYGMPASRSTRRPVPPGRSSRRKTRPRGRPTRAPRRRCGCARSRARRRSGRSARSGSRPTTPARRAPTAARSCRRATPLDRLRPRADHRRRRPPGARAAHDGLPAAGHGRRIDPQVTWLRPDEGADVNATDPVEIEVEAWDERGDLKEVRLSVDGPPVQTKVSFPFQLRWQPAAADVGRPGR